jgi:HNH endonuclease
VHAGRCPTLQSSRPRARFARSRLLTATFGTAIMSRTTARLETPFAVSLRTGDDDVEDRQLHHYYWTGWRRRHWPAEILRPGVQLYGFDLRRRALRALLEVTRGSAFVYRTKREFADKVQRLTGRPPNTAHPHWENIPGYDGKHFNTGIALRWRVLKTVRIPVPGRFPQLGWMRLDPRAPLQADIDPAEQFLDGGRRIQRHMRTERNPLLRARAKDLWRSRLGRLKCLACGFSFERRYGRRGADFIEMHHETPVATLLRRSAVSPQQLKPLCANCHRMVHRQSPMLTIRALKRVME